MLSIRRNPIFLTLVLLFTLAGCLGDEEKATNSVSVGSNEQLPDPIRTQSSGLNGQISLSSLVVSGDVWLSPSESQHTTSPPVDKNTVKVAVDENGNFEVNELPSGSDYSLVYIDNSGNGAKVDNISLTPDEITQLSISESQILPTGSVSFSVQSLLNGVVFQDARVYLHELDMTLNRPEFGQDYKIDNLPEGSYSLTVSKDGYVSKYFTFNVQSGQQNSLPPVELNENRGQLVGMVELDEVSDYSRVLVYAQGADGSIFTSLTSSGGLYKFPALPVGDGYSLIAIAHDYQPTKVSNISIERATTSTAPTISLSPLYAEEGALVGFARFSEQAELSHAGIIVSVEGTSKESITARDGAFVVDGLEPGKYTVNFTDANHKAVTKEVTVVAGDTTKIPRVKLQAMTGQLMGRVLDDSGAPVANANVVIDAPSGTMTTVSSVDGEFSLNGVIYGQHRVLVSKEGYGRGYVDVQIAESSVTDISDTPVRLQRLLLTGKVSLGSDVTDHSGVSVSLSGSDASLAVTDSEGNFILYGVDQGNYQLQLSKDGFITKSIPLAVTSRDGYSIGYTLQLERALGILSGVIELQTTNDFSGIAVSLQGTGYATFTNALGAWSMELPVGDYSNVLLLSRSGYESGEIATGFEIRVTQPFNVEKTTLNAKTARVNGVVQDERGSPVANATVSVITPDASLNAVTDDQGMYYLTGVPVGTQTLIASKEGYGTGHQSVELIEGEDKDLSSSPLLVQRLLLTGKVSLEGGSTDLSGVNANLVGSDITPAITDAEGNFTLFGVDQGNYQLQLSKAGYLTETIPLAINSNSGYAIPYTIELEQQQGLIKGVVRLAGFTDSSGILVHIQGTPYQTYTDALGGWSIEAPIGNYENGIRYSKVNFSTLTDTSTVTVTESGAFAVAEKELQQVAANLSGTIAAPAAELLQNIVIELTGLSGLAKGSTAVLNPDEAGFFSAEALPLGEYLAKIYYPDGLHETLLTEINLISGALSFDFGSKTLRQSYLLLNQGELYTNQRQVSLELGNIDAVQMALSEGGTLLPKEDFSGNVSFTLSAGDGEKTVTAELWDAQGLPLSSLTDSIILDTQLVASSFNVIAVNGDSSRKGDTLLATLDLGETGADARITLAGIANDLPLLDNGTGGDALANDGVYQRLISIETPVDLNTPASASVTDRAGNMLTTSSSSNLVLNIPPTIANLQVSSNVAEGSMNVSFSTDEPARSSIHYGDAFSNLSSTLAVSSVLKHNHEITLSGLPANQLTYFKVVAIDTAGNESSLQNKGKLAPPPPENITVQAGDNEVGLIWDEVRSDGVIGYFVYRSENDGAFIKVNPSPIKERYYRDAFVANGNRYQYKIATTDGLNESEPSEVLEVTPSIDLAGPTELAGGVIDRDTIWLKSRSPYRITADIKLKENATLAMLPGSQLKLIGDDRTFNLLGEFIGHGTETDQVDLTTAEYQNKSAGGVFFPTVDAVQLGSLSLTWANIENFDIDARDANQYSVRTNSWIKKSNIIFDHNVWSGDFYVNSVRDTNVTRTPDSSNRYGGSVYLFDVFDSVVEVVGGALGDGGFTIATSFDSKFYGGSYSFQRYCYGCDFYGAEIRSYDEISGSSFKGGAKLKVFSGAVVKYSVIGSDTVFENSGGKLAYNYWGGISFSEITGKVNAGVLSYDKASLFPIISSSDIYQADNDADGIPDYIDNDNDNDNDGYSDQQEYGESDPEFGYWYNPMDASSHPVNEKDNDFDGITDALDHDDDNDGLSDDDELMYLTNPFIADTDGDAAKDGDEVTYQYDPKDKMNFPYVGNIGNIEITRDNVNALGYTYWLGDEYCYSTHYCYFYGSSVLPGVRLVLADPSGGFEFHGVEFLGESSDVVFIRSVGNVNLSLYNGSYFRYVNMKVSSKISNYSNIFDSDIYSAGFENFEGAGVFNSSIFTGQYTNYSFKNHSRVEGAFYKSVANSYKLDNLGSL